jgi:hypothetical protein
LSLGARSQARRELGGAHLAAVRASLDVLHLNFE